MPAKRENWAAVMERLLEGDKEAFLKVSRLVRNFLTGWRAYDFQDEWSDLIQETVMAAMEAVRKGHIREPEATLNYIRSIARNQLARHFKRHLKLPPSAAIPIEEVDTPADGEDREIVTAVRVALAGLEPERLQALLATRHAVAKLGPGALAVDPQFLGPISDLVGSVLGALEEQERRALLP